MGSLITTASLVADEFSLIDRLQSEQTTSSLIFNTGVPHDATISPVLFILLINDMLCSRSSSLHYFADNKQPKLLFSSASQAKVLL